MKKIMLLIAVTTILLSAGDLVYKNKKSVLATLDKWHSSIGTWNEIDDVYKKDKEVVLKAINDKSLCIIDDLDSSLQKDKEIVLDSLTKAYCGLKYADENLSSNKELIVELLKHNYKEFNLTRPEFQKDEEVLLAWLEDNQDCNDCNKTIGQKLLANREFVLKAIGVNENILSFISNELLKDRAFVLKAVKANLNAFSEIPKEFQNDKKFVLEVIVLDPYRIYYLLSDALQKDKDILKIAPKDSHREELTIFDEKNLKEELKKEKQIKERLATDKEYALAQLKKRELMYLSSINTEFLKDRELLLLYMANASDNDYEWNEVEDKIDNKFLKDKSFLIDLVEAFSKSFKFVYEKIKDDRNATLAIVKNAPWYLDDIDEKYKKDEAFIAEVLSSTGYGIEYATTKQQDNRTLVAKAIEKDSNNFAYLSKRLKGNKELVLKVVNNYNFKFFNQLDNNLSRDEDILSAYLKRDGNVEDIDKEILEDKSVVKNLFMQTGKLFEYLPKEQQQNKKFILEVVANHYNFDFFNQLDNNLSRDEDVLIAYLNMRGDIEKIDKEVLDDKVLVKNLFMRTGKLFEFLSKEQQQNKELVLKAIESKNTNLNFFKQLDNNLSRDTDVVIAFLKASCSIDLVDSKIFENKALAQRIFEESGEGFEYLTKEQQKDKETLFKAIKSNAPAFDYADDSLKKDKSFILKAIQLNGSVIHYVDNKFEHDQELLWASALQNGSGWVYADDKLKKNPKYLLAMLKHSDDIWDDVNETLKKDKSFMLKAIASYASDFKFADKSLREDKDFVLEAIKTNPYVVKYIADKFKNDKEIKLLAVAQDGEIFKHIDDREVAEVAIQHSCNAYRYLSDRLKKDRELAITAVKYDSFPFIMLSDEFQADKEIATITILGNDPSVFIEAKVLKKDKEFILEKLREGINIIEYIDEALIKDKSFIMEALKANPNIFKNIYPQFQKDKEILELMDELKHPLWKKIFNPLTILLFGLFGYWFLGRKKV